MRQSRGRARWLVERSEEGGAASAGPMVSERSVTKHAIKNLLKKDNRPLAVTWHVAGVAVLGAT